MPTDTLLPKILQPGPSGPRKSKLLNSLMRLSREANLVPPVPTAVSVPDRLLAWQDHWSKRREQIAQRLALIDAQLEEVARQRTSQMPPPPIPGAPLEALVPEI